MAKQPTKKQPKKKPTLGARVLATLAKLSNGATTDKLAKRLASPTASVSCACSRLAKAGKLRRLDGGKGRGTEAVWAIA